MYCHNARPDSMVMQRKKPAKLMWTQSWRRLNKKGLDSGVTRKKSRKTVKIQRAIVGVSLDEIKKKTVTRKVNVATEAALKEEEPSVSDVAEVYAEAVHSLPPLTLGDDVSRRH